MPRMTSPAVSPLQALCSPIEHLRARLNWVQEMKVQAGRRVYHAFCPVHDVPPPEPVAIPERGPKFPLRIWCDADGTVERLECDAGCEVAKVLGVLRLNMMDLIASPWSAQEAQALRERSPGSGFSQNPNSVPPASDATPHRARLNTVRLSNVASERIAWLWPGRIPLGKLTMLAGDPGLGKTFLTHDIAARVSSGAGWPDQADELAEQRPGDVLLLSAEDGLADTIRPRLEAARADLSRVHAIMSVSEAPPQTGQRGGGERGGGERGFSLERDIAALDDCCEQLQAGGRCVRLIVIDPISAYLGRVDSHNNAEVRGVLAPLADLAGRHAAAVLAVTHLNKASGGASGGKAIYRSMGSLAFMAAARAGWLVTRSADDRDQRLLLPAKMNIAREPAGLAFSILDGCVAWSDQPVSLTADEALAGEASDSGGPDSRPSPRLEKAVLFLREQLAGGERPASEIEQQAAACGITDASLRRARKVLNVRSRRGGFGAADNGLLRLPGSPPAPCNAEPG